MIRFVNAKLNLGLNVVRKREDGYHDLETLFYPVGLFNGTPDNPEPFCDILEIHRRDSGCGDELSFYGNPVDCPPENNLVYKALVAFNNEMDDLGLETSNYSVALEKHIPDGAGLGGGSADASFTLTSLNELNGTPLDKKQLINIAAKLGADCPFFIENRPVLASGIGEIMRPFHLDLNGYWAVIVKPEIYVSTKEAFSGIKPQLPERSIEKILAFPVDQWEREGLKNDFEFSIFKLYPELEIIKNSLKQQGAQYAAMSGSGSSIFGLFPSRESALSAYSYFLNSYSDSTRAYLCKL